MTPELARTQRTVEPDGDRPGVLDRGPEGLDRLSGEGSPRGIGDRSGDDQRDPPAGCLVGGLHPKDRRFCVEGVEDRLDDQQVRAASDQALGRLLIGDGQLVERDVACPWIICRRRD